MLLGRIVNQDVDPSELAHSLIDCFLAKFFLANVAGN
jgi:hypothetical protein